MDKRDHHNPFEADETASSYDIWFEMPLGKAMDDLQKALIYHLARPQPGESALDMGTGTGHYACDLASRGLRVVGYDSSEAMLRVARAKDSPVIWQRGEAEVLPFTDNSFDLVLSVTTLEFVDDPARALSEMFRVVAPGGRLVVAVLNATSAWGKSYIREALQQNTPFRHAHLYTPNEFVRALSVHGQVHWNSSGFFTPSGRGARFANLLESIGQAFCRGRGALLVGRIDK